MSAPRRAVRPRPRRRLTLGARTARRAGWLDPRRRPGRRFRGYPFGITPIRRPTLRRLPTGRFRVTVDVGGHPDRHGSSFQRFHRVRSMTVIRIRRAGPGGRPPVVARDPAPSTDAVPGAFALFGVRADLGAHLHSVRRGPTFGMPAEPLPPGDAGRDGRTNSPRPGGDGRESGRRVQRTPMESRAGFGRVMRWLR
ncbi:hypothetical protein Aca07nite_41010 [Actinoplanes capillaceus]|uniref:Uncharacterized protein n=1 Tax=Actinoplanes campanulatus TaxID=113559 RepID=A0ABQ3WKQ2_9ACTN|nr:hypothetical protein [Actinoplanes capillaceus]GID46826.1 hypothetical protein Aca07nite_41010 [Actinoplanes capillaceus]